MKVKRKIRKSIKYCLIMILAIALWEYKGKIAAKIITTIADTHHSVDTNYGSLK